MKSPLDNVELQYQHDSKDSPIKITNRTRPDSALAYIRKLLSEGFRGNIHYYRDNDRRLILKVWEHEGLILDKDQRDKFLNTVTMPDTITRRRRELRAEYPDSDFMQKKRFNLFVEKREQYGKVRGIRRLIARKV